MPTAAAGRRYTAETVVPCPYERPAPRFRRGLRCAPAGARQGARARLREIYRSAGWPCQDPLEIELLAAGLLDRVHAPSGHESLRVTDAGIQLLATTLSSNRAAFSAHEALVERVALEMGRAGRVAWRGLALRAQVPAQDADQPVRWCVAKPDVFSIRNTSVAHYVDPIVHEVKVRRADLLGDLRQSAKRAAYLDLGECWYVLGCDARGRCIADPGEVPPECGVLVLRTRPAGRGARGAAARTPGPAVRRVDGAGEGHAGRRPG